MVSTRKTHRRDRSRLHLHGIRVVLKQFGDDEHREAVEKRGSMSDIHIDRRAVSTLVMMRWYLRTPVSIPASRNNPEDSRLILIARS